MKKILLTLMIVVASAFAINAADKPVFPGGDDALKAYIDKNLKYPQDARDNGIEGVVNVAFTVNADGSIGGIKIVRMIDPDLEAEAIRLVKSMPAWEPATKNGSAVDSKAEIAIPFRL